VTPATRQAEWVARQLLAVPGVGLICGTVADLGALPEWSEAQRWRVYQEMRRCLDPLIIRSVQSITAGPGQRPAGNRR
jgi:hypothetical protein